MDMEIVLKNSVTRVGDFRKFLEANFLINVVQIFGKFLGYFEVCHYIINNYFDYFFGPALENLD